MTSTRCEHTTRVKGRVERDFLRPDGAEGPAYTATVAVGVCEECGHIELYAMFHEELCAWLKKR